ncbi:hypothetical protein O6H91_22G036600 [Diphasiastrum complanatum]|uniref:Uncharacterized protein n=1 Tax=Diphasiastrum complanatum TaxID=34168 RepID=A0ACC2AEH7_DIPCM|nr:hypothetical protein O6H91_22G036600 [Diphasiastrum complanatum]
MNLQFVPFVKPANMKQCRGPSRMRSLSCRYQLQKLIHPKNIEVFCLHRSSRMVTVEKDDDDITSGTILRRAIQHGLVSSLLKQGWTSLDDDVLLMGNIATWEEGQPLLALSLEAVHLDKDDQLVFVFSPDVLCFRRAKPISVLPEAWRNKFSDGQIIDMTDILHCDNGDISHEFQCCVLPSMKQGHIAGIAKNLPENKGFYQRQLFWTCHYFSFCQYGIEVPKSCFYVNVLLQRPDGDNDNLWLPSSLILKKSGLMPAAPSVRCSKAACSLEHFRRSVAEWNFFNAGHICFEAYASEKNHVNQCVTWTTVSKTLLPPIQPGYGCTKGWNDAQFGSAEFGTELQTLTSSSLCSIKKFYRPKPFPNVTHGVKEEPKKKIHAVVTPPLQIKPFMPRVSLRQTIRGVQKAPTNITPMPFSRKEEHRQIEISYSKDKKISPIGVQKPPTNITPMHFSRKEEHRQIEISYSKDKKISPIGTLKIFHPGLLKFKRKTSSKGGDIMSKKSSSKKSLKGDDRCSKANAKSKVSGEGSCSAAGQIGRLHLSSQSGSSPGRAGSTIDKGSRSHRAASATNFEGSITDVHSNFNQVDKLRTSSPTLCNPIAAAHSESNTAVDALVYEKHAESRLKELNVTDLKNFLRSRKAKLSGRKEELIERIQQLLSK